MTPPSSTPTEQVRAAIVADAAYADPALWIHRVPDAVLMERAAVLEAEGPRGRVFWGVPVAVKDNIDVAGMPTTAGCPAFSHMPDVDAVAVRRLLEAGAVVMGKTNLDQFATGLVGVRSPYGTPRAPFDRLRVPGGSSSGSGVAVAAGIVPVALGTDTAGSGRVPAMFGNIVGLRPTVGAVPSMGMVPACRSIDTVSVFARTVDEALSVARVIAGYVAEDAYSRRGPAGYLRRGRVAPGLRVGVPGDLRGCEGWVREAVTGLAAELKAVGVAMGVFEELSGLLYAGPWVAERTAALRGMLERPEAVHPVTLGILREGLERRTVNAFDAFHVQAQARRAAAAMFERVDALIVPTAPCWPSLAEVAADPIGPNSRLGTFTNFVGLCDLVGIAVPCGFGPGGDPVGVTVVGPAWSEGRLAGLADWVHRRATKMVGATSAALPGAAAVDEAEAGETALFCVGAHMSGLPLNGQVTGLGGRFLREARTIAGYRLFALGNRPGMVRGGDGVIAGEVWAMPTSAIGALLEHVPAPLGFGAVSLETGSCLGFLAESAGVEKAPEITPFGGWRAYLASLPL